MKKFLKVLLALSTACMIFAGCTDSESENEQNTEVTTQDTADESGQADRTDINRDGKLIIGTNPEFPPFEYVGDSGEIEGFDVDLMNEVGKRLGYEVEFKSMEFKSLIGAMEAGSIDAVAAGMSVTDERKLAVDFSDTYFNASQYIIVNKGNEDIKKASDLAGKIVGVQEGTTGDVYLTENVKTQNIKRFKKGIDAVLDLKNGGCDAVFIDAQVAMDFVAANEEQLVCLSGGIDSEEYAVAFPKGSKLVSDVNKAIAEMRADGTYKDIYDKYFEEKSDDETEDTSLEEKQEEDVSVAE